MTVPVDNGGVNGANHGRNQEKFDTIQSVGGYLVKTSAGFDKGVESMNHELDTTLVELTKDPSNPVLLAKYQSLLSEYTLYRGAQSSVVKNLKDVANNIISNFR